MQLLITSIIVFASTNIDDIFILILFYGNKDFREREIVMGQFLGIITLIGISVGASLVGLVIDPRYIGLLGLLPVYLGIKGLMELTQKKNKEKTDPKIKAGDNNVLTVAGTTVANGGDNIGIYTPLFATLAPIEKFSMVGIFLVMTFLWCVLAKYSIQHPYVARAVDKYGHIVTPFVLILLGLYILYESKTVESFVSN